LLTQPASLTPYTYALNNPILYSDPSGEFIDTLFDAVSVGYDIYTIGNKLKHGCALVWQDWAALGVDAFSLAVPFFPSVGGMALRLASHGDDLGDLSRAINKISGIQKYLPKPRRINFPHHHIFPRRSDLAQRFARQGIDIHQHLMELPIAVHKKIHSSGPRGGMWNRAWENFFEQNPEATAVEIYKHAGWLIHEFGLDKVGKIIMKGTK